MLKPVNPIVNRVTEAKRRAARVKVLTDLSVIECVVFKKVIDQPNDTQERPDLYGDVEMLGSSDEQAFSYDEKGFAKLLISKFAGGAISKDWSTTDGFEQSFYGQIEPIILNLGRREELLQIPDWNIDSNDVLAAIISPELIIYFEVVGIEGQSLIDDFGTKYRLNKRDDFNFIEPFVDYQFDVKTP